MPKYSCTCICGSPMVLRSTTKFRYGNGQPRRFWGCSRWPSCDCVIGAHPDGEPLGIPADREGKDARMRAHAAFDPMVEELGIKRGHAYAVMAREMRMTAEEAHIGKFDVATCDRLVAIIESGQLRAAMVDDREAYRLRKASHPVAPVAPIRTIACPGCLKLFRTEQAQADHWRDRHGPRSERPMVIANRQRAAKAQVSR